MSARFGFLFNIRKHPAYGTVCSWAAARAARTPASSDWLSRRSKSWMAANAIGRRSAAAISHLRRPQQGPSYLQDMVL